ncbi:MAG TPA: GNAT family N-acetyltransferase [Pseudonocardiaceae bacterium]|jgi:GNAT superfamily N-acetyltransferase|nr:GNAT family N-acetyltransferase [Pseudonocardiaceae bacterium]
MHSNGVRPWDPLVDLPRLVDVSHAAGALFAEYGLDLPPDDPANALLAAEQVLVASAPHPVGFAMLTTMDGDAHLGELAVHPAYGRRGIGGRLLSGSCDWAREHGFTAITLTTFAAVPWNAPWYAARGFTELPEQDWGPDLHEQWAEEKAAGIIVAPRVAMIRRW